MTDIQNYMGEITGPPVTPELQTVFGSFGIVRGIVVQPSTSNIDVTYDGGSCVTFIPIRRPPEDEGRN